MLASVSEINRSVNGFVCFLGFMLWQQIILTFAAASIV